MSGLSRQNRSTNSNVSVAPGTGPLLNPNAPDNYVETDSYDMSQGQGPLLECGPDEIRLPNPVPAVGALSYYENRRDDFVRRYSTCGGRTPPDYYINYGKKYVDRFTNEVSPMLSPEGQQWLVRARLNLQTAIENRRAADPAGFDEMERDGNAFRDFAYGTHADAYWNAGLGDLSLFDLARIGTTPNIRDLLGWAGIEQVADIGSRLVGVWGEDAVDYLAGEGTAQELADAYFLALQDLGDELDSTFGPGTTDTLRRQAHGVVNRALAEARGLYDEAGDAVDEGLAIVEDTTGIDVEAEVDAAREFIQDEGVDAAEEVWDVINRDVLSPLGV
jgi:hypothetical protein